MLNKLLRLYHTLKFLKPTQLAFFIIRRKFPAKVVNPSAFPAINDKITLKAPNPVKGIGSGAGEFCFLNICKDFSSTIDWSPEDVPRLWRYNLHYFDFLREASRTESDKIALMKQWVIDNPQGSQPGWEPFTASLRIVNWIYFIAGYPGNVPTGVIESLYTQMLWLEKNDERHILANHYFENLKAMAFAGVFFTGPDAMRWQKRAEKELIQQLNEQTLPDGGHYERTPQYHALMLENYLDIYNLVSSNPGVYADKLLSTCQHKIKLGLALLREIQFPDNSIPLLNDSAFGIAPSYGELHEYGQRLFSDLKLNTPGALIRFPDSGYFGYCTGNDMVIIDAGDVGPDYQPGHTHCDMLSYELMWGGERLVVDSGVCEYEPGPMRSYVRSTRAHNTLSIDGAEQSEVWGEFRVARRAAILEADISNSAASVHFVGAYQGFPALKGPFIHRRTVDIDLTTEGGFSLYRVDDEVRGEGEHLLESFIHLHPDVIIDEPESHILLLTAPSGRRFRLEINQDVNYYREQAFYCPEFGVKIPNTRIVLSVTQSLPARISYSIINNN